MTYSPKIINGIFEKLNDQERYAFLLKEKDNPDFPEYQIQVDNDAVFVMFKEEEDKDEDDIIIPSFDEFGYSALVELLKASGINADFV